MNQLRLVLAAGLLAVSLGTAQATDFKREVIDESYQHDKYGTQRRDLVRPFRAYITSFDSDDDDDGDGRPDMRGIPEWVAYEIRKHRKLRPGPKRPSPWITDPALFKAGIAPSDATYKYSASARKTDKNPYVRGHLCMKEIAWRLGAAADWNTHTVLNAVPQRQKFNAGIWLDLEKKTAAWADRYGTVWIITGPIFKNRIPTKTLGEKTEMKIAIPDALFKIVIKESALSNRPDILAFIYTQECNHCLSQKGPFPHEDYLTSVKRIEELTGLSFFNSLPGADRTAVVGATATRLWD